MAAYNIVRFQVKPGQDERFINEYRNAKANFPGFRRGALIKIGERSYCTVGEWDDFASLAAARKSMIALLDRIRDALEDLGGGLGVTDPMSGEVLVELSP